MVTRPFSWMVVCGLGVLCSCASEPVAAQARRIPYHVVIVPLADPFAERQEVEAATSVELRLDVQELTQSLKELLSERFSRVTVLSAEPGARLDDVANEARSWGADLVFDAEIDYEREVIHGRNQRALANGVLFLLGGPLSWYFDDNTYEPTARASFEFFDLNLLDRALERSLTGARSDSRVEMIRADAEILDMDLIDRTDRLGHYALSIVLPATFIASDADKVQRTVREEVKQSLFDDLLSQLKPETILTGERNVYLQWPYDLRRVGEELVLEGKLVLQRDAHVESYSPTDLFVTSGGDGLEDAVVELGEPVTGTMVRTQSLKVSVPESSVLRDGGYFQLWLDEDTQGRRQSWTFGQGDVRVPPMVLEGLDGEVRVAGSGREEA